MAEGVQINPRIKLATKVRLEAFRKERGCSQGEVIEAALEAYFSPADGDSQTLLFQKVNEPGARHEGRRDAPGHGHPAPGATEPSPAAQDCHPRRAVSRVATCRSLCGIAAIEAPHRRALLSEEPAPVEEVPAPPRAPPGERSLQEAPRHDARAAAPLGVYHARHITGSRGINWRPGADWRRCLRRGSW